MNYEKQINRKDILMIKNKTISIVTSTYNSEKDILEFLERILAAIRSLEVELTQFIIVDDGSTDETVELLKSGAKKYPFIQLIELSKNFGQHEALLVGLSNSKADLVYLTDSDLEEEPENVTALFNKLVKSKADVIYGVQPKRRGKISERIEGKFFYNFITKILGIEIQTNILTSRIMTKNYVDAVLMYGEKRVYLGGIFSDVGFNQQSIELSKNRFKPSRYSLRKKVSMAIKLITSFSNRPLKFFSYIAAFQLITSTSVILVLCLRFLLTSENVSGWTSIVVSIWFTSGLIASMISLVMIYIYEILQEVKNRPRALVRDSNLAKNT